MNGRTRKLLDFAKLRVLGCHDALKDDPDNPVLWAELYSMETEVERLEAELGIGRKVRTLPESHGYVKLEIK